MSKTELEQRKKVFDIYIQQVADGLPRNYQLESLFVDETRMHKELIDRVIEWSLGLIIVVMSIGLFLNIVVR